jgi:acyl carrier protein
MDVIIEDFLEILKEEFPDETDKITADFQFRNLDTWSSMQALLFIAFIDEKFDFLLTPEQIKNAKTFSDIHKIIFA